ncbi:MAG: histidine kinase [Bacteroidota bacterium]
MQHTNPFFRFLFSLLISTIFSQVSAQKVNTDSIFNVLNEIESAEAQLLMLDTICDQLEKSLQQGGDTLFEKRQALAKELLTFEEQISRVIEAAAYFNKNYLHQKGIKILQPYFEQVAEVENWSTKSKILNAQAAIYSNQNQFEPAIELYEQIVEMYDSTKANAIPPDPDIYRSLGKNLYGNSRFGESSVALNKAKTLYLESNDSLGLEYTYLELAVLFSQIGLYDDAAFYVKERQKYISPPSDLSNAFDNINLGRNLILQERYQEAIDSYHESIHLGPFDASFDYLYVYIYNGLVEAHYFSGQTIDSVNYYFEKLNTTYQKQGKPPVFEFLYLQSLFLNDLSKGNYASAEETGLKLYADAQKDNDSAEYLMYTQFLSELYRKKQDYRQALLYADLYNQASDSIQTANKANALLLYQTQYETKEKENTIQNLRIEKELQEAKAQALRNTYFAGFIILLLLGIILFIRLYYRNKFQRALQIAQLRTKISNDLHDDVGSILTGLAMQSEVLEQTAKDTDKTRLSKIAASSRSAMSRMRDAVWAMDAQKDNWQSLMDRMQEFAAETLSLKDIRFNLKTAGIQADQSLSGDLRQNLYLIFKEAITNVIKHTEASQVNVTLNNEGNTFEMNIQNDGLLGKKEYTTTGLGLESMKKRAKKIDGQLTISDGEVFQIIVSRSKI